MPRVSLTGKSTTSMPRSFEPTSTRLERKKGLGEQPSSRQESRGHIDQGTPTGRRGQQAHDLHTDAWSTARSHGV